MRALSIARIVWLELLRKKDIYVLLILLLAMLLAVVSLNIFGLGGTVRYVADSGLTLAWLFSWILAINVTSRELPQEETRGTVFPMLAKPITRLEFLVGKWLGCWGAVTLATIAFHVLVYLIVAAKGSVLDPVAAVQAILLHAAALGILCATALLFSTRMNADAGAAISYVVSAASFFVVPRVPEFVAQQGGFSATAQMALYHLLPHFEVFDMRKRLVHAYGPAPWPTVALIVLYGLSFTVILVLLAWLAYRNKKFSRGDRY
jgi:ABC-type transport system involved in multi-copper enzyme maturation permease subunit